MLDSILIAQSGLSGFEKGLKTIGDDVSNMNTIGYKAATASFSDVYVTDQSGGNSQGAGAGLGGSGVDVHTATLDLSAGQLQQTGNALDAAVDGNGFFVFEDAQGNLLYSKDGQFQFDSNHTLVGRVNGLKVLGVDAAGKLAPIDLTPLSTNPPKATSTVVLDGNLSSSQTSFTVDSVSVYDALGGTHALTLNLTADTSTPGLWSVSVLEGTTQLTSGQFRFTGGLKDSASDTLSFSIDSGGGATSTVSLSLADTATSYSTGTTSSLALKSQDGYAMGTISSTTLDEKGVATITYSNGQTAKAGTIALAMIDSGENLVSAGQALYKYQGQQKPKIQAPDDHTKLVTQSVEASNVDLTTEFSNLILMQRGYQASSEVLTTANEMIQALLDMKGRQ
jgi:flagellar hook protein FlgE